MYFNEANFLKNSDILIIQGSTNLRVNFQFCAKIKSINKEKMNILMVLKCSFPKFEIVFGSLKIAQKKYHTVTEFSEDTQCSKDKTLRQNRAKEI